MLDLCLVLPPNPVLAEPLMQAPLGPLYLAAAAREHGFKVSMLDLRDQNPEFLKIGRVVPASRYYGFTGTSPEFPYVQAMARTLPYRSCIIGGAHATAKPDDCLDDFGTIVRGEGEKAIIRILGQDAHGILTESPITDIDSIPFPARDILRYDRVFTRELYRGSRYGLGPVSTTLLTSRGCPFSCSFCANWDRKIRYRSPENVAAEVQEVKNHYGCRHFKIIDDNFTLNKPRALEICKMLEPMRIRFRCHSRSNLIDRDLVRAMYRAGCREISFGVEVPDDEILERLNKRETVEDHKKAIELAKKAHLRVKIYLMICVPYETWETVQKVKIFMKDTKPDKWTLSTFVPYPGCDIYENPEKYDCRIVTKHYQSYWLYQDQSLIETRQASQKELTEHRIELYNWLLLGSWK